MVPGGAGSLWVEGSGAWESPALAGQPGATLPSEWGPHSCSWAGPEPGLGQTAILPCWPGAVAAPLNQHFDTLRNEGVAGEALWRHLPDRPGSSAKARGLLAVVPNRREMGLLACAGLVPVYGPLCQGQPVLGTELCLAGLLVAPALQQDLLLQLEALSLQGCSPQWQGALQGYCLQLAGALQLLERGLQRCLLLLSLEFSCLALSPEDLCDSSMGRL